MSKRSMYVKKLFTISALFGIGISCFVAMVIFWYPSYRWPSPIVHPLGQATMSQGAIGSWGVSRRQTYTISRPLEEIQKFYGKEMERHCITEWEIEPIPEQERLDVSNEWGLRELPEYAEELGCHEAQCQVRRLWMYQEFKVLMCHANPSKITVVQIDLWKD